MIVIPTANQATLCSNQLPNFSTTGKRAQGTSWNYFMNRRNYETSGAYLQRTHDPLFVHPAPNEGSNVVDYMALIEAGSDFKFL